jgi:hypothetical protein
VLWRVWKGLDPEDAMPDLVVGICLKGWKTTCFPLIAEKSIGGWLSSLAPADSGTRDCRHSQDINPKRAVLVGKQGQLPEVDESRMSERGGVTPIETKGCWRCAVHLPS